MNNTIENKHPVTYFSNDTYDIVQSEAEYAIENPMDAIYFGLMDADEFLQFITDYVKKNHHKNEEKVKELVKDIDVFDSSDVEAKIEPLIDEFYKDEKAVEALKEEFIEALYRDYERIDFIVEDRREMADEDLKEDGFLGDDEKYIIIGTGVGWLQKNVYFMATVNSEADLERAITGNYDYTIHITREDKDTPWLHASVYHHDAPTGESFTCIPVKWLNKALEDEDVQKLVAKYDAYIEADLEEIA